MVVDAMLPHSSHIMTSSGIMDMTLRVKGAFALYTSNFAVSGSCYFQPDPTLVQHKIILLAFFLVVFLAELFQVMFLLFQLPKHSNHSLSCYDLNTEYFLVGIPLVLENFCAALTWLLTLSGEPKIFFFT